MLPTTDAVAPTHARLMKSVGLMWMLYSVPTMWRATEGEGGGAGEVQVVAVVVATRLTVGDRELAVGLEGDVTAAVGGDDGESEALCELHVFEVGLGAHLVGGRGDHRRGLRRVQLEQLIREGG